MPASTPTRRERLRTQTLAEIKQHAMEQVAEGGSSALSLNAVAKAMGMSGPAIYRYFASRDELLGALITDAYAGLVAELESVLQATRRRGPAGRLEALADAYRAWGLEQPERYLLAFGSRPPGFTEPEAAIATLHGGMEAILEILGSAAGDVDGAQPAGGGGELDRQLQAWAAVRSPDRPFSTHVLHLGVLTWTRIHGVVSLDLLGVFPSMGLDAGLLARGEVAEIAAAVG
jgi:AcrR family transcriptional regulator